MAWEFALKTVKHSINNTVDVPLKKHKDTENLQKEQPTGLF